MRKSTRQNSVMKIKRRTGRRAKSNQLMRESVNGNRSKETENGYKNRLKAIQNIRCIQQAKFKI